VHERGELLQAVDVDARLDVESLKKLSSFMQQKLQWLEKPVNVDAIVDQSYLPR